MMERLFLVAEECLDPAIPLSSLKSCEVPPEDRVLTREQVLSALDEHVTYYYATEVDEFLNLLFGPEDKG